MQTRTKLIIHYSSLFLLSILMTALVLLVILKITVLNPNYIFIQFNQNDYYSKLYLSIKKDMSLYTDQSGLDDTILENIYTESTIRAEIKSFINNLYSGKTTTIDTDDLKKNIEKNIDKYLEENNLVVGNQEELDLFINEVLNVYINSLTFSKVLDSLGIKLARLNRIILGAIIFIIILIAVIIVLNRKIAHRNLLSIPFITTSLLILLGNFLFFSNIDAKHIIIWNENVSQLITSFINSVSLFTILCALLLIILAISYDIIRRKKYKRLKRL